MIISNLYGCAATYLNSVPQQRNTELTKKSRRVEAVSSSNTGRRFNQNAGTKANHNHI